jgi:hypothetical protein
MWPFSKLLLFSDVAKVDGVPLRPRLGLGVKFFTTDPQVSRRAKVSDWFPVGLQRVELIASIRRDFGDTSHTAGKNTRTAIQAHVIRW